MTRPFILSGHRGARGLYPENTLTGFIATCALGVDTLELDIAVTADGVAVVSHDPALHHDLTRGPDGRWLDVPAPGGNGPVIRDLTLAEVQRYDVGRIRPGSKQAALFPDQVAVDGAGVPTLDAVIRATGGVTIDAELKTLPDRPHLTVSPESMADALLRVFDTAGATQRLVVRSFDWRGLAYLREVRPEIPLVWLTAPDGIARAPLWWGMPDYRGSVPAAVAKAAAGAPWRPGWAPHFKALTEEDVGVAHSLGLSVLPWTVNDGDDMARLIGWGVDGLCTDRPDIARLVMADAGLALPVVKA
jgi:glycerophosphoryl diester phosphodiesterase